MLIFLRALPSINSSLRLEYLDENGLLRKYQSGFRANVSTDSCLAPLTNFILRGIDKGFHTGMILAGLQKAFDTLDDTLPL